MFKSIKRAVATLATLALFVSSSGIAYAQTFNDVPSDAWYFDYVEQLVDDGVFDVADYFRPADSLNRAELVKIVITAIDGLADYEAPATPTFDDVPADAWYFDFVESAFQLGIVSGYTDAAGNLTGMFGPGDSVDRAAATKILVNAFAVPTDLEPASPFADVPESAWFHDYVLTAYNQSVLDGYDDGTFGPANNVLRSEVAKLTVTAQDPIERPVGDDVCGDGVCGPTENIANCPADCVDVEPGGEGDLEVSLNDDTPPSSTMPLAATSVELLNLDFTAADDDVVISNVVVTRAGVGQTTDFEALYLYDGAKRLTTGRSINSDTNTATFSASVLVEAGTTKTLRLLGDVGATGTAQANNQHYFYIASAADVTSNAQSTAGDFPVSGNLFTVGSVSVTSVAISAGSVPAQPQVGASDVEIAAIRLAAGADNDVALHQLTLTQNGSLSSVKLVNLRLLHSSDEIATAEGFDGDLVTFVLDTPYIIDKGQTKNFYVRGDIDGGRPGDDTIQLYLDENTDLIAIDQQYGYGTTVTNNYGTAQSTALTLKGGKVTLNDNGPAAKQIAQNTSNVALLDYSITADRDITVKNMDLVLKAGIGNNYSDVPAATAIATIVAGAVAATGTITVTGTNHANDGATVTINGNAGTAVTAGVGASDTSLATAIAGDITANVAGYNATSALGVVSIQAVTAGVAGNGLTTYVLANTDGGDPVLADTEMTGGLDAAGNLRTGFRLTTDIAAAQDIADAMSVTVAGTTYYCAFTNAPANTNVATLTTDCPSVVVTNEVITYGLDPYQWVENVRIVDVDSGGTLQGPVTRWNATTTKSGVLNTTYSKQMTEDYDLTSGETRHLRVEIDLNQNMPSGLEIESNINYVTAVGYLKDVDANKNVAISDIVGGNLTGKKMTVKQNSLTVAKTSNVISQQYVKGADDVDALQVALQAGDAGDITIKKLTFRVYGDLDGDFSNIAGTNATATGDIEGKVYVERASLYDGDTLVAGPESLELVGASVFAAETATIYDKVLFDDLSILVPKGNTKNLTLKLDFLNNFSTAAYVAVDMEPSADITAEDSDANTVTANSGNINRLTGALAMNPYMDIIQNGTLTASSTSGSISPEVLVGGTDNVLVAQYSFTAEKEAYNVNKITILNDLASPRDTAVDTNVIESITLVYPDINGVEQTKVGSLTAGSNTFSDLGFYVGKDDSETIKVYVDTKAITSGTFQLSGKSFSLAMLEGTTNTSSTFEAIGASSSEADYFNAAVGTDIKNSANIQSQFVRKSKPVFAHLPPSTSPAQMGVTNNLYQFTVSADGGDVTVGRLVFDVTPSGLTTATNDVYNFKFQAGESLGTVSDVIGVNIYGLATFGAPATKDLKNAASGAGLQDCDGTDATLIQNGLYKVIVSFDNEETVEEGESKTYVLKADATGATTDDTLTTSIASGDEGTVLAGLLAANSNGVGSSGILSDVNTDNIALFGDASTQCGTTDNALTGYSREVGTACNVVWSDQSGGLNSTTSGVHSYPTVTAGSVANATGTVDYTNGYLLNVEQLDATAFKQ